MRFVSQKKRLLSVAVGGITIFIFGIILIISLMDKKKQLRSDFKGVEFVTEGETITHVNIHGKFPYQSIVPNPVDSHETDFGGNVTQVYTIEAEFSLNRRMSMRLDIETSDEVINTYILKFADKDVMIINGKVVEEE